MNQDDVFGPKMGQGFGHRDDFVLLFFEIQREDCFSQSVFEHDGKLPSML
jgi:hypothetical protein